MPGLTCLIFVLLGFSARCQSQLQVTVDCAVIRNCSISAHNPKGKFCLTQNLAVPAHLVANTCPQVNTGERSADPMLHRQCHTRCWHYLLHNMWTGQCQATHARFLDTAVELTGQWTTLSKAVTHLNSLDPKQSPVVLLAVSSLACEQGCCIVSFFVRPGDTDGWVLQQMLSKEHGYSFIQQLRFMPRSILDAGANAGFATVVLAHMFPAAMIIALEPDPANYQLLLLNTRRFGNVRQIQKGLWDKEVGLQVNRRVCNNRTPAGVHLDCSWGVTVSEIADTSQADVHATSIPVLLKEHSLAAFDYAKIDIEGAERQVFATPPEWVTRTKLVSIEVHEEAQTSQISQSTAQLVAAAFPQPQFFWTAVSEYHVYIRKDVYEALRDQAGSIAKR